MRPATTPNRVRDALASLPSDRATIADLADALGVSVQTAYRAVARSVNDGEVEVSVHPVSREAIVCLTPLGADRAGVVLTDDSSCWVAVGTENALRFASLTCDDDAQYLSAQDKVSSLLDRVIRLDEWAEAETDIWETHILGVRTIDPITPKLRDPLSCPAHPGRLPRPNEWCLYCEYREGDKPKKPRSVRIKT